MIDDKSGNIHATKTLDREERAQYTLMAQAVDRDTNRPLEPPSEFIVKVQDINDNPPEFLHETYHANVPERSNVGAYGRGDPFCLQAWSLGVGGGEGGEAPFSQIRKENLGCIFYDGITSENFICVVLDTSNGPEGLTSKLRNYEGAWGSGKDMIESRSSLLWHS